MIRIAMVFVCLLLAQAGAIAQAVAPTPIPTTKPTVPIYASSIVPTNTAQATFGGSTSLIFPNGFTAASTSNVSNLNITGTVTGFLSGFVDATQYPYFADPSGATDSRAKINNALAAAGALGQPVCLENGTYMIDNTSSPILIANSNVGLYPCGGTGGYGNGGAQGVTLSFSSATTADVRMTGTNATFLRQISILDTNPGRQGCDIDIEGATVDIRDVAVNNFGGYANDNTPGGAFCTLPPYGGSGFIQNIKLYSTLNSAIGFYNDVGGLQAVDNVAFNVQYGTGWLFKQNPNVGVDTINMSHLFGNGFGGGFRDHANPGVGFTDGYIFDSIMATGGNLPFVDYQSVETKDTITAAATVPNPCSSTFTVQSSGPDFPNGAQVRLFNSANNNYAQGTVQSGGGTTSLSVLCTTATTPGSTFPSGAHLLSTAGVFGAPNFYSDWIQQGAIGTAVPDILLTGVVGGMQVAGSVMPSTGDCFFLNNDGIPVADQGPTNILVQSTSLQCAGNGFRTGDNVSYYRLLGDDISAGNSFAVIAQGANNDFFQITGDSFDGQPGHIINSGSLTTASHSIIEDNHGYAGNNSGASYGYIPNSIIPSCGATVQDATPFRGMLYLQGGSGYNQAYLNGTSATAPNLGPITSVWMNPGDTLNIACSTAPNASFYAN